MELIRKDLMDFKRIRNVILMLEKICLADYECQTANIPLFMESGLDLCQPH